MTFTSLKQTLNLASLARITAAILAISMLTACGAVDRLANIGQAPKLAAIEDPTSKLGYREVNMPMPVQKQRARHSASLWSQGNGTFFGDNRAANVGDIVTVNINISDKAKIDNSTTIGRSSSENFGIDAFGGIVKNIAGAIPNMDPSNLVGFGNTSKSSGNGSVNRNESLSLKVAAIIIQKLPNGNLVIEGKQEVRVNFEVRELIITGIVRPSDISSDNTIDSSRIAEARISYGGRGHITNMQQARYGKQVLDILLPF
ncbi:MAG: flagellar basal body L-ring protein FlgH [Rhizobiales bacterium]|nr:flagellar basal body L-ring protein FlgH [Hyphomicrobiales bacterium]NRB13829.1 flagellar basal body L-ring protein FlgH [Hyphomicrobiales bacterium]